MSEVDRTYLNDLFVKLGLPESIAQYATLVSFSDGSVCVKIVFDLGPDEILCSYKLKQKFGA